VKISLASLEPHEITYSELLSKPTFQYITANDIDYWLRQRDIILDFNTICYNWRLAHGSQPQPLAYAYFDAEFRKYWAFVVDWYKSWNVLSPLSEWVTTWVSQIFIYQYTEKMHSLEFVDLNGVRVEYGVRQAFIDFTNQANVYKNTIKTEIICWYTQAGISAQTGEEVEAWYHRYSTVGKDICYSEFMTTIANIKAGNIAEEIKSWYTAINMASPGETEINYWVNIYQMQGKDICKSQWTANINTVIERDIRSWYSKLSLTADSLPSWIEKYKSAGRSACKLEFDNTLTAILTAEINTWFTSLGITDVSSTEINLWVNRYITAGKETAYSEFIVSDIIIQNDVIKWFTEANISATAELVNTWIARYKLTGKTVAYSEFLVSIKPVVILEPGGIVSPPEVPVEPGAPIVTLTEQNRRDMVYSWYIAIGKKPEEIQEAWIITWASEILAVGQEQAHSEFISANEQAKEQAEAQAGGNALPYIIGAGAVYALVKMVF